MGPKPRKSDLWTMEKELQLIGFMKQQPYMWDSAHKDYFHMEIKRTLFMEIATFLGSEFTADMVKDRWTNMRTTFLANYKRAKSIKNNGQDKELSISPIPSWHLYSHLAFLESTMVGRSTINNQQFYVKELPESETFVCKLDPDEDLSRSPQRDGSPLCQIAETVGATGGDATPSTVIEGVYEVEYSAMEEDGPNQPPCDDGRSIHDGAQTLPPATPKLMEVVAAAARTAAHKDEGDEWDDFGRMVSKILRRMPERDAREVQVEFFKILHAKSPRKSQLPS